MQGTVCELRYRLKCRAMLASQNDSLIPFTDTSLFETSVLVTDYMITYPRPHELRASRNPKP